MAVVVSSEECVRIKRLTMHERSVWWSSAHTYKNAITNELFLHLSAKLYNRFKDASYLGNAKKVTTSPYITG